MGELVTGRLGEGVYENSLHLLLNFAGTLKLLKKKKKKKVCLKKKKVTLLPEIHNVQQDRLPGPGQFPGRTEVPGRGPLGTECLIYITKIILHQA